MGKNRIYRLWGVAILCVALIAAYEAYWLWGLYHSQRQSLETQISSLVSKAELNAYYTLQLKSRPQTDSLAYLDPDNLSKVASISRDSSPAHRIKSISIYKKKDLRKTLGIEIPLRRLRVAMDSVLAVNLKQTGIEAVWLPLEIQAPDTTRYICVKSVLGYGTFLFPTGRLAGFVLRGMWGVMLTSLGVILIVTLSFVFFIRTLNKQMTLDEMKSSFTANVTHELKTPIAVACAANDALLNYGFGDDPAKRTEYLQDTRDQLEKLSALVERILSMSMKERGEFRLDLSEKSLKAMLVKIAQETRLRAPKHCDVRVEASEDLTAIFDAKLMSSVVSTLADNAVKYAGEEVQITLSAFRRADKICIAVSDNGIGIAAEDQKHVFEKFYRVPHGDRHDVKGYGIGLYFAKTIVERHNGRITLTSRPGRGSTFTIEL